MENKIEAFRDKNGKYTIVISGSIDHRALSSFEATFFETQAKIDVEQQKTLREQEKTKQSKNTSSAIISIIAILIVPTIAYIIYLYLSLDNDSIKKYKIDMSKYQQIELSKIEKDYLLSLEKLKLEANKTK